MVTINDVCRVAGVSKATVSRVINGTGQVKASTREHVEAVMASLNYRPSSLAKALATNSSNSIGLVLSNYNCSYFGGLLEQAAASAEQRNKQLLIADGHDEANGELSAIQSLIEKRCDVIVLYSRRLTVEQLAQLKAQAGIPIVVVGRHLSEEVGFSVSFNQYQAAYKATDYMLNVGHRSLVYVGPKTITPTAISRFKGFEDAISQFDQAVDSQYLKCDFGFDNGHQLADQHRDTLLNHSGIVASSDDIAIGILKSFHSNGIRVPDDISVIGIDNDPLSRFVIPSLTSVDVPIKPITESALTMACCLMEGTQPERSNLLFDGELMVRDSVKVFSSL